MATTPKKKPAKPAKPRPARNVDVIQDAGPGSPPVDQAGALVQHQAPRSTPPRERKATP